jgi:hypothetical protein
VWQACVSERETNPHAADLGVCVRAKEQLSEAPGQGLIDVSEGGLGSTLATSLRQAGVMRQTVAALAVVDQRELCADSELLSGCGRTRLQAWAAATRGPSAAEAGEPSSGFGGQLLALTSRQAAQASRPSRGQVRTGRPR